MLSTLDNLPAYLDVSTTPDDLLPWLAAWLGMSLDPGQATDRQREVLRLASRCTGSRARSAGSSSPSRRSSGCEATVQETGAADWSLEDDAPLPGEPFQAFVLQVSAPAGQVLDEQRLDALVSSMKPAHVVHRVEVHRTSA